MANKVEFCTCTATGCPNHPNNHDQGCTLCIAKNMKYREIPGCFFNMLGENPDRKSYYFEDFAREVLGIRKEE